MTVTVEDAPESDGQLTVTESTVPVNRFVVTPLTVARNRIGAPTTRAAGGVVVEMSRVRVITEGCVRKLIRPATGHRHGQFDGQQ